MAITRFLEVLCDATRVAFPLQDVARVIQAAAVQPVPGSRGCLLGALDVGGDLVTVYDARRLLGLPSRPLRASDRIVIAARPARCALLVDGVAGIVEAVETGLRQTLDWRATGVRGVATGPDGMLLVHDLRRLLDLQRAIPLHPHA